MNEKDAWFGVELRHLAALAAVAREGSFRGAADSLGYVQSSVSQQIVQLERLVGTRLVDRSRGSKEIRITPLGELLVDHAGEILSRVQAARADLASHSEAGRRESLKVGVSPGVATGLLPSVLRGMATSAPELEVEPVESASDSSLFALVERGEVDVAFADLPLPPGAFESRTILRDPFVLLASAGSEWVEGAVAPTAERLAQTPLVVLDGACSTGALEMWFATQGLVPDVARRAACEASLRAFVAGGLGVAIVPRMAVEPWDARIQALDLEGIVPERQIAVYWHNGRLLGGALEVFCNVASGIASETASGHPGGACSGHRPQLAAA